ncbi:DmsC/YnfH family molybdoenzyme membrane anchor subunit [Photobacterium lucens]|uniref:DmsC/YnfH family molybdoenzyme membrane anchor subunit n=1 Tax=Photobacterium lucens TaxID=2562949 RepID=UPI00136EAFCC|nr:DmsC/YnfH family molybdoenzyme membrane anchor subunit [Photobacterium lucens]MZG56589.1 hypothetical protein [Photobacterium lucens]MZG79532.1 hypothetical protein [Photobacterium lucens]
MQWADWPFIISQVLTQFSIGAFTILGGIMLTGKLCFGQSDRVLKTLPIIWVLLIIAMLLREGTLMFGGVNSVSSFGLETFFALSFIILTITYWFCEKQLVGSDKWRKLFLIIIVVWGGCYFIDGVLAHAVQLQVVVQFILAVLLGGALLAHSMLVKAEHKLTALNRVLPFCGAVLALVAVIANINGIGELVQQAEQGAITGFILRAVSIGSLLIAVGLWLMPLVTKSKPVAAMMFLSTTVMSIASITAALSM